MTPSRWARLREVFGAALELPEGERRAYVERTFATDPTLREEVQRLLDAEREPLENPVLNALAGTDPPELTPGEMLGPYRVEARIGQGGMGVVYRAWDTRLDRRIALKALRPDHVGDPTGRQSLVREARAASALTHPNIVAVYDIGCERDIDFIAMEHVEGKPLSEIVPAEGLPPRQAVAYGVQIAQALACAHAAGVVHRDLKPGNVMIARDGSVKLLDFGLARKSPTIEGPGSFTRRGGIAGTPQYMSPEQIRGDAADHRSDIFSFGATLYRMLAGRDLFDGGSPMDALGAILHADAAGLCQAGPALPEALKRIVLHCVEKAPADRFQSAQDLAFALESAAQPAVPLPPVEPGRKARHYSVLLAAAALALGVLASYLYWGTRARRSAEGVGFFQITDDSGAELFPSLSPKGDTVAYAGRSTGNWDIYLHKTGSPEAVDLTKDSPADDTQPAFSPDGRSIAFRSDRNGGGIFVMGRDGAGVHRVSESGYSPAWSPDGREIAFAQEGVTRPEDRTTSSSQLWIVDVSSGRKRLVVQQDGVQPQWSPGGQYIAYWAIDRDGNRALWTVRSSGGPPVRLTQTAFLDWNPVWSPDGAWLYFCSNRGGSMAIWRMPMKESAGEARGAPEPVRAPGTYPSLLSFSRDGQRMAYVNQITSGRIEAVRFDPDQEALVAEPKEIVRSAKGASRPALSPDGQWLAYNSTEGEEELYVARFDGAGLRQITAGNQRNRGPRWSPDGKRIALFSRRSGDWEIWTTDPAGEDFRQLTSLGGYNVAWPVWSPDGRRLAYTLFGISTFVMDTAKPFAAQEPVKLPPFSDQNQSFNGWDWSRDGRSLAGFLNRDDGVAIYSLESRTFRRLTEQGAEPVWLSDSRRLLYLDKGKISLLDSATGHSKELVSIAPEEIARRGFAVSADDARIYFSVSATEADVWMAEFEK